jgi:hypothetical protein
MPCGREVIDIRPTTRPRPAFQVPNIERAVQECCLGRTRMHGLVSSGDATKRRKSQRNPRGLAGVARTPKRPDARAQAKATL